MEKNQNPNYPLMQKYRIPLKFLYDFFRYDCFRREKMHNPINYLYFQDYAYNTLKVPEELIKDYYTEIETFINKHIFFINGLRVNRLTKKPEQTKIFYNCITVSDDLISIGHDIANIENYCQL